MQVIHGKFKFVKNLIIIAAIISLIIWAIVGNKYGLVYCFAIIAALTMIGVLCGLVWIAKNRRKGIYPQKGQTTTDDVKRLALSGYKLLALNAHREITGSSLKEAMQEVDKIIAESIE